MKKDSRDHDIIEACELAIRELKRMLKRKEVPVLTKNSIKFLIPSQHPSVR